ncbi:MAG: hypothetical protein ABSE35_23815, partial [Bryobacteraceae bacterium]
MVRAHGAAKRNFRRQEECRQQARQAPQDGLGVGFWGACQHPLAGASFDSRSRDQYQSWRLES